MPDQPPANETNDQSSTAPSPSPPLVFRRISLAANPDCAAGDRRPLTRAEKLAQMSQPHYGDPVDIDSIKIPTGYGLDHPAAAMRRIARDMDQLPAALQREHAKLPEMECRGGGLLLYAMKLGAFPGKNSHWRHWRSDVLDYLRLIGGTPSFANAFVAALVLFEQNAAALGIPPFENNADPAHYLTNGAPYLAKLIEQQAAKIKPEQDTPVSSH